MTIAITGATDDRVKRLRGKAELVLVDAPCTGLGTLRRNPDLKWRQSQESLAELVALQAQILDAAAQLCAPEGRLVYATCSVLPEENQAQAEWFLSHFPDFVQVDVRDVLDEPAGALDCDGPLLQLRPDRHETDGFFAAIFERKGATPAQPDAPAAEPDDDQG